ncbi:MAG: flagellar hook capping FlgD N-terminal domain-containing protein [Phycisphaerales bacterium]|jgi:flagellar basal-body rod modification protein FlgD
MSDVSSVGSSTSTSKATGFSSLSSQDFTKIILQELSHQDPLNTTDTNQLIQQLSGIRSIQSNTDLSDKLTKLVAQNDFTSASTLIGKQVSGIDTDNGRSEGIVKTVSRTSSGSVVTLESGARITVDNLDQVQTPADTTGVTP